MNRTLPANCTSGAAGPGAPSLLRLPTSRHFDSITPETMNTGAQDPFAGHDSRTGQVASPLDAPCDDVRRPGSARGSAGPTPPARSLRAVEDRDRRLMRTAGCSRLSGQAS